MTVRASRASPPNGFDVPSGSRMTGQHDRFSCACDYPPGVALFRQGEPSAHVFLLERGLVKLLRDEDDGSERIVGLRGSGWFLGAAAAILSAPYAATGVTVTSSRLSRMTSPEFRDALARDPSLSLHLHETHSREVYAGIEQVTDLISTTARQRLMSLVRRLAPVGPGGRAGAEIRFELPLRQWEIAQIVGVTPPYLCQVMAELERAGRLRRDGRFVILRRVPGRDLQKPEGSHSDVGRRAMRTGDTVRTSG